MKNNNHARIPRSKFRVVSAIGIALAWVVTVGATNVYVVPPGTPGAAPDGLFQTWATAATNIQTAINTINIIGGNTVFVSNGVYVLTNQLSVTKGIYLRSWNNGITDRTNTVIDGGNYEGRASTNRCISIGHAQAVVDGFTFRNGVAGLPQPTIAQYGGGVEMKSGLLTNCLVVSNSSIDVNRGGGGIGIITGPSIVTHCDVLNNKAVRYGGGVYVAKGVVGQIKNCLIAFNESSTTQNPEGGGGYCSEASDTFVCRNSVIRGNSAVANGGGVLLFNGGGLVENCEILDNTQSWTANYRGGSGVTIYGPGTVRNCLIAGNSSASVLKSAVEFYPVKNTTGVVENCTIVANIPRGVIVEELVATDALALIRNSIIYDNIRPNQFYDTNYVANAKLVLNNCCTTPLPDNGTGNITSAPQFVNPAVTNYQLKGSSPCIDAGVNLPWMNTSTLDLAGQRRLDAFAHVVDMGCYEFQPSGMTLIIR